jgi:hypothetical protein
VLGPRSLATAATATLLAGTFVPRLESALPARLSAPNAELARLSARAVSCEVSLPTTWSEALTRNETAVVPLGTGPIAFAVSANGQNYFADYYATNWSGIVEVSIPSGAFRQVYEFPSDTYQVYQGAFDGRWLVWTLSATTVNPDPATLMAWDSLTGRVTTLVPYAGSSSVINFTLASSGSQARDGLLAWTIIPDLVRGGGFSVWSLSSSKGESVHTGGSAAVGEFIGGRLFFVYVEKAIHYGALSTPSWRHVAEPAALKLHVTRAYEDSGSAAVSVTARDVVWVDPGGVLNEWPADATAPQVVAVRLGPVEDLTQAGTAILWTEARGGDEFMLDTRSNSYARLPMRWGYYFANGSELTLSWSPNPLLQKAHPVLTSSFIDVTALPKLPDCRA